MPVRRGACLLAVSPKHASVAGRLPKGCWLVSAGGQRCSEEAGPAGPRLLLVPQGWAQGGRWAVRDNLAGAKTWSFPMQSRPHLGHAVASLLPAGCQT